MAHALEHEIIRKLWKTFVDYAAYPLYGFSHIEGLPEGHTKCNVKHFQVSTSR